MYYDLFDHDTSTSRTHFVIFVAFTVSITCSCLEVIWGRWFLHQSKGRIWLPVDPQ